MKKLIEKFSVKFENFQDNLYNKLELKKWNKLIKKACKKHYITNKSLQNMYKNIQKDVLTEVNKKPSEDIDLKTFSHNNFSTIVKQRIYDLNREFVFLVNGEFHNSIYALTRQMSEICITLIKCRQDTSIIEKILTKEKQEFRIGNIVQELRGKIRFPYTNKLDEDKFLESLHEGFKHFSNLVHLSGKSLSQNMWILNKEKNHTRWYIEDPEIKEGEILAIFSKRSAILPEQYKFLIHQFYTFSGLSLSEIKLLEKNKS